MRLENKLNKSSVMVTAGANQVGKNHSYFFFPQNFIKCYCQKKKIKIKNQYLAFEMWQN